MYANDVRAIMRMLERTTRHWLVCIEPLDEHPSPALGPCVAHLTFARGRVCTCQVRSRVDGRLLFHGMTALRWLENLQHFFYTLQTATLDCESLSPLEEPLMLLLESTPRCSTYREKRVLDALPRQQRQVLKLVDGNRTVGQIVATLHQPLSTIGEALHALAAMGMVQL